MESIWNYSRSSMGLMMKAFLLTLLLSVKLTAAEVHSIPAGLVIDVLDCPCGSLPANNPLKGLSTFTVLISAQPSEGELFTKELEKIGKIKKLSLSDPKGINFEGMGTGARLQLFITSLSEKEQIKRITLSLSTDVEILETKHRVESYVWMTNQFTSKDAVNEAIKHVVNQFSAYYKNANPNSLPFLYVYQ